MYSLTRGPSKLASRTNLRGPVQQIDKLERFEKREAENTQLAEMSSPRPVFNGKRNYNRSNSNSNNHGNHGNNSSPNNSPMAHKPQTSSHEENIRFISYAWQRIHNEYEQSLKNGTDGPVYYQEKIPSSRINGFEPVNLDQWHQQRLLEKMQS